MMINEKMLREDKNTFLRNSIISFSQSPHQPKSKKPISAVAMMAILLRLKFSFILLFSAICGFIIIFISTHNFQKRNVTIDINNCRKFE